MTTLDREFQAFEDNLASMVPLHDGQYVVIKGASVENFFDTYEAALDWAYERFGLNQFFVKKVAHDNDVAHFTRDFGPCRL